MKLPLYDKYIQRIQDVFFYLTLRYKTVKIANGPHIKIDKAGIEEKVAFTIASLTSLPYTCNLLDLLIVQNPSWNYKILLFDLHQSADTIQQEQSLSRRYEIIPVLKLFQDCKINIIDFQLKLNPKIIQRLVIPFYINHLFNKETKKVFFFHKMDDILESGSEFDKLFINNLFLNHCKNGRTFHDFSLQGYTSVNLFGLNKDCKSIILLHLWMRQIRLYVKSNKVINSDKIGFGNWIRLIPQLIKSIKITNCQSGPYLFLIQLMRSIFQLNLNPSKVPHGDEDYNLEKESITINSSDIAIKEFEPSRAQKQTHTKPDSTSVFTRIPLYDIPIDPIIQRLYNRMNVSGASNISSEEKVVQLIRMANEVALINPPISRYWYEVYHYQDDLQKKYPDIVRNISSRINYLNMIDQGGLSHYESSIIVADNWNKKQNVSFGISLSGYFQNIFGIAEIGRAIANTLITTSIPISLNPMFSAHHRTYNNPDLSNYWEQNFFFTKKSYQINIFMVNADLTPRTIQSFEQGFFLSKYKIGCWFWEIEGYFPFEEAFDYVDEIWGFSDFCCDIFREYTDKPVHKITYPFQKTWNSITDSRAVRTSLGIDPTTVTFFFNFDFHSCFERKNPLGIIEAFLRAFNKGNENVALIIKSINAEQFIKDAKRLQKAVQTDPRIMWINQSMAKDELISLIHASDCYISLHRSEGLGIGMIEAMYLGKCVIATAFGGNLDFMDKTNSFLIDYSYIEVQNDFGPYKKGCRWADPCQDQAVQILKQFYLNHEQICQKYGEKAMRDIREKYNPEKTAKDILQRVYEINS